MTAPHIKILMDCSNLNLFVQRNCTISRMKDTSFLFMIFFLLGLLFIAFIVSYSHPLYQKSEYASTEKSPVDTTHV